MADRSTYSHTSDPMPDGLQFLEQYADRLGQLFNASILPLTGVGGTGDAVTATLDPPLLAGLAAGMKFTLTWAAANTGPVTLAINGGAALPVVDAAGVDLDGGALQSGERSLIEYVSGSYRVLSAQGAGAASGPYYAQFTTSGTWNKPAGLPDDAMVLVEAWGAGGGGSSLGNGGGGGGGGYNRQWFRAGALPSSVSVTIGSGGAVNGNGGSTTFGSLLTAFGGLGSSTQNGARGGSAAAGGLFGAGLGGATAGTNGGNASTEFGGAGGGAGDTVSNSAGNGGQAMRGGGGGGGRSSVNGFVGTGGASVFGGSGGNGNAAGVAPGGGGGRNAAGARGELRIWIPG